MKSLRFRLLLAGLAAAFLIGCQKDEIRTYEVPKPEKTRLLGAIAPHGDSTWFVKLSGPASAMAEQEKAFDEFIHSLRFKDADKLEWTLPADWRKDATEHTGRYATILVGPKDAPLELTITRLGKSGQASSVLANVNRWRNQLALPAVKEEELGRTTKSVDLQGVTVTLVDLTGTGAGKTGMGPPMAGAEPKRPKAQKKAPALTYQTPEGWKKMADDAFSLAKFQVGEGDRPATVSVTPLPGGAGGLEQNINRWRGQIGLQPISGEEIRKLVQTLKVAGQDCSYVDLVGPNLRTLAVIVPQGETTWFIKMTGPTELVGKQKANFETFAKSIRFGDGPGGNDG